MLRPALVSLALMTLGACAPQASDKEDLVPRVGMPNPASVHCVEQGGRLEARRSPQGDETGFCVFKDGRQCEEWALLRDKRCVAPS